METLQERRDRNRSERIFRTDNNIQYNRLNFEMAKGLCADILPDNEQNEAFWTAMAYYMSIDGKMQNIGKHYLEEVLELTELQKWVKCIFEFFCENIFGLKTAFGSSYIHISKPVHWDNGAKCKVKRQFQINFWRRYDVKGEFQSVKIKVHHSWALLRCFSWACWEYASDRVKDLIGIECKTFALDYRNIAISEKHTKINAAFVLLFPYFVKGLKELGLV